MCFLLFTADLGCAHRPAHPADPAVGSPPDGHAAVDTVKFLAGGALGLVHSRERSPDLRRDLRRRSPTIIGVNFGPFPFFAITHRGDLSPRRENSRSRPPASGCRNLLERMAADQTVRGCATRMRRSSRACSRSTCSTRSATRSWRSRAPGPVQSATRAAWRSRSASTSASIGGVGARAGGARRHPLFQTRSARWAIVGVEGGEGGIGAVLKRR